MTSSNPIDHPHGWEGFCENLATEVCLTNSEFRKKVTKKTKQYATLSFKKETAICSRLHCDGKEISYQNQSKEKETKYRQKVSFTAVSTKHVTSISCTTHKRL